MKTLKLAVLALLLVLLPSLAMGQTALTATSTSAAMSATATSVVVASATGITVPTNSYTALYIDKELMTVIRLSGTTVYVIRGQGGTQANAHISGAIVWVLPATGAAFSFDPQGACTGSGAGAGVIQYTPWINQITGNLWVCSSVTGKWGPFYGNPGSSGSPLQPSTAVASAAGLVTPTGPLFHMTGGNAVTGFNVPVGFRTGYCFTVISDSTWTWTNANNIAVSSTATQTGTTVTFCYDAASTKPFFPSHL